ncbi:hypothetical protein [Terriglobus tenax]|uniref:hypothetical protein n=1 Tax=Terriglobus tenax TaxID=1111115 RepID=UPI0021E0E362|nr:hypothetical protein [Terriglobus tenax]
MHKNQFPIGGRTDIQFNVIRTGVNRSMEGRKRIFRMLKMLTTMRDDGDLAGLRA